MAHPERTWYPNVTVITENPAAVHGALYASETTTHHPIPIVITAPIAVVADTPNTVAGSNTKRRT